MPGMKPKKPKPAADSDRAMEAYERLPEQIKELSRLKDEAEKSSGPARTRLDQKIRAKTR